MPSVVRVAFRADLGLVQDAMRSGVVASKASAADRQFQRWLEFCASHSVDPWFSQGDDPVPYLQVFAARYRDGRIAPGGHPVRSGTVSDALRDVGQAYQRMGAPDPRFNSLGRMDLRLSHQIRSYTKEDPPSDRVKPILTDLVREIL